MKLILGIWRQTAFSVSAGDRLFGRSMPRGGTKSHRCLLPPLLLLVSCLIIVHPIRCTLFHIGSCLVLLTIVRPPNAFLVQGLVIVAALTNKLWETIIECGTTLTHHCALYLVHGSGAPGLVPAPANIQRILALGATRCLDHCFGNSLHHGKVFR